MKPSRHHDRLKHGSPLTFGQGRAPSPKFAGAKGKASTDGAVRPVIKPAHFSATSNSRKSPTSSIFEGERYVKLFRLPTVRSKADFNGYKF